MRKLQIKFTALWALVLLTAVAFFPLNAAGQNNGKAVVKVMTYNVNEGTDFIEVLSATTPEEFVSAVQTTLNNIDSTKPSLRMQAVAKEIAQTAPVLVGLQEVTTWSVDGQVRYDMLQELLDSLHNLGADYAVVVEVTEFQLAGPLPDGRLVQGVNHDVILARADSPMQLSNVQQSHFSINLLVPLPVPPFVVEIPRGWGSVDVSLHGRSFRFIVSHLEQLVPLADPTIIQKAQAFELITGPGAAPMPVIIAVDTNADALGNDPSIATYQLIRSFGLGDAWAAVHPDQPGATWGFMPDPNDLRPIIHQRIDYIFFSDEVRALTAQRAGIRIQEKVDGLWPSDHAGVRATLLLGSD